MKTLRVELADLEGIPHSSAPASTRAEVTAAYTGIVALTDGTLIPNAIKAKTVASSGAVNFSVYPSDSPDVREEYHGFGVTVTAKIQSFNGTVVTARRTVVVPDSSPSTVHLGNLAPADPLPPQWVTVGDLVGDIESAAGTAEWAGITGKPDSFPPSAHAANHATGGSDPITPADIGASPAGHDHAMGDVTGLVDEISGTFYDGGFPYDFGPGTGVSVGFLAGMAYGTAMDVAEALTRVPRVVTVVTGDEERPFAPVVFWIGGTTEPVNMETGDVWFEQ